VYDNWQYQLTANIVVGLLTGNSTVDIAAKVLYFYHAFSNLSNIHSDYSLLIRIPALKQLLHSLNNETQSKLHAIERTVISTRFVYLVEIEIKIIIQKLRIGHTYLTHRHLLQEQSSPSIGRVDFIVYFSQM